MHDVSSPAREKIRFVELDALRGIAALWVVLFHYTFGVAWNFRGVPEMAPLIPAITPTTFNIEGLLAVDLFFVISGFVILMTVERSPSVLRFAASRFARLYPAYWAAVLLAGTLHLLWPLPGTPAPGAAAIAVNMTMLQEFLGFPMLDSVYWSLSIELGFYALMAAVLVARGVGRVEWFGLLWLAASVLVLKAMPALGALIPWRLQTALALPHAPMFVAGIMLYRIRMDGLTVRRGTLLLAACAARLAGSDLVEAMLVLGIFLAAGLAVANRAAVLRWPPLLFLGAISYPLYLTHAPLGARLQLVFHEVGLPPWVNLGLTVLVAIAVATLVTVAIERPGSAALRRYLSPRRETSKVVRAGSVP